MYDRVYVGNARTFFYVYTVIAVYIPYIPDYRNTLDSVSAMAAVGHVDSELALLIVL